MLIGEPNLAALSNDSIANAASSGDAVEIGSYFAPDNNYVKYKGDPRRGDELIRVRIRYGLLLDIIVLVFGLAPVFAAVYVLTPYGATGFPGFDNTVVGIGCLSCLLVVAAVLSLASHRVVVVRGGQIVVTDVRYRFPLLRSVARREYSGLCVLPTRLSVEVHSRYGVSNVQESNFFSVVAFDTSGGEVVMAVRSSAEVDDVLPVDIEFEQSAEEPILSISTDNFSILFWFFRTISPFH